MGCIPDPMLTALFKEIRSVNRDSEQLAKGSTRSGAFRKETK